MNLLLFVLAALLSIVSNAVAHDTHIPHVHSHEHGANQESKLSFLAVGDWGGMPVEPYFTPGQKASAKGMDTVARNLDASFILALGDNMYLNGVQSPTSVRFNGTFQQVYTGKSLMKPWYIIAGNHDHLGDVNAQIEYTALDTTGRWNFPSLYHKHSFTSGKDSVSSSSPPVTVDVVLIDTVDLCSMNVAADESEPHYFDPLPLRPREMASEQWAWIEAQLAASTADYLMVGGHFPVYSVCEHGSNPTLIQYLKPLLEQYNAHYMSGHDHCMIHMQEPGSKVNYILSGLGDTCCYESSNIPSIPKDTLQWYVAKDNHKSLLDHDITAGFTSFEATKEQLVITYYDQHGNVLYTAAPIASRNNTTK